MGIDCLPETIVSRLDPVLISVARNSTFMRTEIVKKQTSQPHSRRLPSQRDDIVLRMLIIRQEQIEALRTHSRQQFLHRLGELIGATDGARQQAWDTARIDGEIAAGRRGVPPSG